VNTDFPQITAEHEASTSDSTRLYNPSLRSSNEPLHDRSGTDGFALDPKPQQPIPVVLFSQSLRRSRASAQNQLRQDRLYTGRSASGKTSCFAPN